VIETNDIAELKAIILAQQAEITALRAVISGLEARLSLNSTNAHKPPAAAGYAKKPALPKPAGGKVGGQAGHPGKTLELVQQPDTIQQHWPSHCPDCHCPLPQQGCVVSKRQVFDLP
jgi:transposase